ARVPVGSRWQPVTVPGAAGTGAFRTSIRWNGRRFQIRDRVDRDRFGAPIVTDEGIVGMVQDERSGVPLADGLPKLGWQVRGHQEPRVIERTVVRPRRWYSLGDALLFGTRSAASRT